MTLRLEYRSAPRRAHSALLECETVQFRPLRLMNNNGKRQPINWRSRIVRSGKILASQITPHPQNPRRHPQLQREAVAASFDELGQIAPIVLNVNNGYLVDGEERSWLALDQPGDVELDAIWVDLTEEEHLKALAYFDATGDLATYDRDVLDTLLRKVNSGSKAIQRMLSELAQSNNLYLNGDEPAQDPGAQVDKAAELQQKWQCERGQLWEIGKHRLLCGDSTNAEDVARVMAGERADAVVTDPPYGIDYVTNHRTWRTHIAKPLANDNHVPIECLSALPQILNDGAAVYWFCTEHGIAPFYEAIEELGLKPKRCLVWDKGNWAAGDLEGDWGVQTEYIAWAAYGDHKLRGSRPSNLLAFNRWVAAARDVDHPTQKPIDLISFIIEKSSDNGNVIYDPFLGSGTTMVACEQLGRQGRGIEIAPEYCSVSLERMSGLGLVPRLVE